MQQVDARLNEWQGALDAINGLTYTDARVSSSNLAAAASTVVVDINGKATVSFFVACIVALAANDLVIEGTVDGTNFFTLPFFVQQSTVGTLPVESLNVAISPTAMTAGQFCVVTVSATGYRQVRMRKVSATGNANVSLRASVADFRIVAQPQPALVTGSLGLTATGATTLLAAPGAGLFNYLTHLHISVGATAAVAAGVATPTITLASPALVFNVPAPITAIGAYTEVCSLTFANPIKGAVNAATTANLSAATAGLTYRVNASGYIGA